MQTATATASWAPRRSCETPSESRRRRSHGIGPVTGTPVGAPAYRPGDAVDRSGIDESTRAELAHGLRAAVRGEVHFDGATRAIYATDSSNYRQVPLGVVFPLDEDDVRRALEVCRSHGAPVLARGAGTSLAGQACNVAVIIEMSRHMDRILELDAATRLARVQPGVVLDDLNAAARALDLTFGPDPATHAWCTLGGMVGNNSCGTHALYTGKTVDCVESLTVLTYGGDRMVLGPGDAVRHETPDGARIVEELRALVRESGDTLRTGFPRLQRRVSGYNLDQLLPENGFQLARALVGSESTCALVTEITLQLSPWPRHRQLVVVAYRDVYEAADAVPALLAHEPIGLEGFDDVLVEQMRRAHLHEADLPLLPPGGGWLLCELGADSPEEVEARSRRVVADLPGAVGHVVLRDGHAQERVWRIRESGLGATARPVGQPVNYEGWEDAAVAPENLGRYLRGVRDLWAEFGYHGAWYGHFGQGCVHTRNNFDLGSVEGLRAYRSFVERAADLCVALGGSISGEHGDGQSRGELLARMYSPDMIEAFRRFKRAWDPDERLNPGKLIDAYPLDTNLRYGPRHRHADLGPTAFAFAEDGGSFATAVERCVGVGRCRGAVSGVMCPSFRLTGDETHSTRGRAKLLVELFEGDVTPATWRSDDVVEALDLCLSCKGCAVDCPTHVDMATYKAEYLHHYYRRRLRPRAAYALGLLPWASRVASRAPRLANAALGRPRLGRALRTLGGISTERSAPAFARRSLRHSDDGVRWRRASDPSVLLWPDTFTDVYEPARGVATARVLALAGERVGMAPGWACCGRPLYDAGMLTLAVRSARRVLDVLDPYLQRGVPVVVVEPSCLATFRDEFPKILPDDPRATRLASLSRSLSEHLLAIDWSPTARDGGHVALHPHCHQRAVRTTDSDHQVLTRAGFDVETLDLGCCGLAGSFGYRAEHDADSRAIAAERFVPGILDGASRGAVVLDGFSCLLQARELTGVATTSTAELLWRQVGPGDA